MEYGLVNLEDNKKWLEEALSAHMSEELPENIEELDRALGEALDADKISWYDNEIDFNEKFEAILKSKGIMPSNWDIKDLSTKLLNRSFIGDSTWDFVEAIKEDQLAIYHKLKDHPSVKKVIEYGGICYNTLLVIEKISEMFDLLNQGKTIDEIWITSTTSDDPSGNHAFFNLVEEISNTKITSWMQLHSLAQLKQENLEDAEQNYYLALEDRYSLALDKILQEGGKYKDLLALKPQTFGLPDLWTGMREGTSQNEMILSVISLHFSLSEPFFRKISIRDVAKDIEAPYHVVFKASTFYLNTTEDCEDV